MQDMKSGTNRANMHTTTTKRQCVLFPNIQTGDVMQTCSLGSENMGDINITSRNPQHYLGFSASMYFLYPGSSGQP